jgi:uncharacterized Zn finger protein (UPF0148 family)
MSHCLKCGYPRVYAYSDDGGGDMPCEICRLRERVAELEARVESASVPCSAEDELADRLEVERRYHDETRGYRQHAEQRIAELEAALREAVSWLHPFSERCDVSDWQRLRAVLEAK